jgi:hypothetical protein
MQQIRTKCSEISGVDARNITKYHDKVIHHPLKFEARIDHTETMEGTKLKIKIWLATTFIYFQICSSTTSRQGWVTWPQEEIFKSHPK